MIRMLILGYVFTIRRRTALFAYQRLTYAMAPQVGRHGEWVHRRGRQVWQVGTEGRGIVRDGP
jgi:hypothetical protein